jgi:Ala-tRNA(Pro) deacylase
MPIDKLREYLDSNRVAYEVLSHPLTFTAQELAAVEHVHGRDLAKVVILRSGAEFVMVTLPALYHVDLNRARAAIGKQDLAIASEKEFTSLFPNCEPGAMPPFGNLYQIPVWVDESLAKDENIVFNACTHYQAIKMKYADFVRLVRPNIALLRAGDGA